MNKQVDDLFERLARGLFAFEEVKRLVNDVVDAAVKEEQERLIGDVCPTLADIAFSADMTLQMCRNKAMHLYERLRAKELTEEQDQS